MATVNHTSDKSLSTSFPEPSPCHDLTETAFSPSSHRQRQYSLSLFLQNPLSSYSTPSQSWAKFIPSFSFRHSFPQGISDKRVQLQMTSETTFSLPFPSTPIPSYYTMFSQFTIHIFFSYCPLLPSSISPSLPLYTPALPSTLSREHQPQMLLPQQTHTPHTLWLTHTPSKPSLNVTQLS